MSKKSLFKRYYNSDSATSLFVPFGGRNKLLSATSTSRMQREARDMYAVNPGKLKLMQFYYWVLTLGLVALVLSIVSELQNFRIKPIVHGVVAGLLLGILTVSCIFVLPVAFEKYCYKRGWLKKSVKTNQKRR